MTIGVTILCAFAVQQISVVPFPATVGEPVLVKVSRGDAPVAGLALVVEPPAGEVVECGITRVDGTLAFVPSVAGKHVFVATIDGVRQLAPLSVQAGRVRWPFAIASVPLGLALLWRWGRRRGLGASQPSTRST
ncbi:MAG: hypothetical protein MUC36_14945 [Planctomycetes bacterium]|nr:hypothetical protein [Planctomycetota bacterium]